jgi:hypothetical protein
MESDTTFTATKGRRVSEGEGEFAIGSHESVVRQVLLHSHAAQTGIRKEFGRTFWVPNGTCRMTSIRAKE